MTKNEEVGWFDVHDAQRYSGIGRSKIYALLKTEEIEGRKVGKRLLISKPSIDALFLRMPKFASKRAA